MFKKEVLVFIVIFLVLALGMHINQWLTHPIEHFNHLSTHKMPYHPLLYTSIVYIFIGLIRIIIRIIMKPFRKR
ncbi:hypothetical protein [Sulfurospirillum oryzae]|uniref:hypothetical protein n=1 Tax=Sulfurospirillum oryzae TaxID=2976535 RepID=UPI0021E99078|nr:hypothetical protein [Sulfurospirillum oryzae]